MTEYNIVKLVKKMRIVNEGADQEDFDELKVIAEVFQVGKRIKELAHERD
jgi:hypothetical protein